MKPKLIFPLFVVFIFLSNTGIAQDFFKDYRKYLVNKYKPVNLSRKAMIDSSIKRLSLAISQFERENKQSFFSVDTVFLIDFVEAETSFMSAIIWSEEGCCSYDYRYNVFQNKKNHQEFKINTSASGILHTFNKEFRESIETGDTLRYRVYANTHEVLDGQFVSPIMAVKLKNKWHFRHFQGTGRAIDYDFDQYKSSKH